MRGMSPTEKNRKRAETAADKARTRVAEELLGEFLGDLYRARATAVPREPVRAWNERCAALAVRPLTEDQAVAEVVGAS